MAQQTAEIQHVACFVANGRDDAHGGGLAVHHADGGFVRDQAADDLGSRVAGNDHHVDADRADGGHCFELFKRQAAAVGCVDHAVVLRHRDECAGQAAHVVGSHHAALFDGVVQQGQAGGGAAAAAAFQTHFFQNIGNAVADGRGGGQRQVDDARRYAKALAGKVGHQLAQTGDLERCALDQLSHFVHRGVLGQLGQRRTHGTGAGNADVDLAVRLARAVERTRHKRVVLGRVAEHDELGVAHAHVVLGQLGGLAHDLAHQLDGVHVDTRLGRANIDAGANDIRFRQCAGNGLDQAAVTGRKALVYQRTKAADEVDPHGLGRAVQRFGVQYRVSIGGRTQQHGNGRNADALVDDGNAVLAADAVNGRNQVARQAGDLVVDLLAGFLGVRVDAVQQADAHGHGTDIEVFIGQHADGFHNVIAVQDSHNKSLPSDGVHGVKDFLAGHSDLHLHLCAQGGKAVAHGNVVHIAAGQVHQHDHAEHILHDGLGDILDIDIQLGTDRADLGNDTHSVMPDDGDNCFHTINPLIKHRQILPEW